jgi:hypothetical protein
LEKNFQHGQLGQDETPELFDSFKKNQNKKVHNEPDTAEIIKQGKSSV